MWLDDCTQEEQVIIAAIAALAGQLTRPLTEYTEAIIQINRRYFSRHRRKRADHNPAAGSLAQTREVRATKRWM